MTSLPPELVALASLVAGKVADALWRHARRAISRRRMAPIREIEAMADSDRFQAIEQQIAQLGIRYETERRAERELIATLQEQLRAAATELAEARSDLGRAAAQNASLARAVEHLHADLQALRRDAGLPSLRPVEWYLRARTGEHEPVTPLPRPAASLR